jgi:hypothetical protein
MLGAIAGDIFGAVPERIETEVRLQLDDDLLEVVDRFTGRCGRR